MHTLGFIDRMRPNRIVYIGLKEGESMGMTIKVSWVTVSHVCRGGANFKKMPGLSRLKSGYHISLIRHHGFY